MIGGGTRIPRMAARGMLAAMMLAGFAAHDRASALDIMPWKSGTQCAGVLLTGEIRRGEASAVIKRIDTAAAQCPTRNLVIGKMPGGSVRDAMTIGNAIRDRGYVTVAMMLSQCFSACGLVYLGGTQRYWHQQALFVIHRPQIQESFKDAAAETSAYEELRSQLIRYVSQMGGNPDYVDAMYDVPLQDYRQIDRARLTAWGLFTTVGSPF